MRADSEAFQSAIPQIVKQVQTAGHCYVDQEHPLYEAIAAAQRWYAHPPSAPETAVAAWEEASRKLAAVGFQWSRRDAQWHAKLEEHRAFYSKHRCTIAQTHEDPELEALKSWVKRQRREYKAGTLCEKRKRLLEAAHFEFDPLASQFEKTVQDLRRFYNKHGHLRVPSASHKNLATRLRGLRQRYKANKLSRAQLDALEDLPIMPSRGASAVKESFDSMCRSLKRFVDAHGHALVPDDDEHRALRQWLTKCRSRAFYASLSEAQRNRLKESGFASGHDARFDHNMCQLKQFVEAFGHADVKQDAPPKWQPLAQFLQRQRRAYKAGKLSDERRERLEAMGVRWTPHEQAWWERFAHLKEHVEAFPKSRLPDGHALRTWTIHQLLSDELSDDQRQALGQLKISLTLRDLEGVLD